MAKTKYIKALAEALKQPALDNCSLSTQDIEVAIAAISERLRGPLSNEERLLLVADRSELRATLNRRNAEKE